MKLITPFQIKKKIAYVLDIFSVNKILHRCQVKLFLPFIRAVNYHDIPPSEAKNFETHLQYYSKEFSPVSYNDLIDFHNGKWQHSKPGLIITFDDGYRSFFEVIAPLLEKYNFPGWFFIPSELIDTPYEEQVKVAHEHSIFPKSCDYGDNRVFLTWEQLKILDKKQHIIGCHTSSHKRLKASLLPHELEHELIASKKKMAEKLEHNVLVFAWVGGEEDSYSKDAARMICDANYEIIFLTNNSIIRRSTDLHLLNRTNIESEFSSQLLRFQISGLMDLMYTIKRRRVNSMLKS